MRTLPSAHDVARLAGVSQAAVSRACTPGREHRRGGAQTRSRRRRAETSGISLIDVNHVLFAHSHDFVDFVDTDEICREAQRAALPRDEDAAIFALCPPTYYSLSDRDRGPHLRAQNR